MGEWYFLDAFSIVWVIISLFITVSWFKSIIAFFLLCSPIILFQGIRIFFEGLMMNYNIFTISLGVIMMLIGGGTWIALLTTKV